jgi:N-methylhydantoinase A
LAQAEAVEIVNFQVTAVARIAKPALKSFEVAPAVLRPHELRQVYFAPASPRATPVLHRGGLAPGTRIDGPAIIEEATSTTVLYPGQRGTVDRYLNIEVEVL